MSFHIPRSNLLLFWVFLDFLLLYFSPLWWKGYLFFVLVLQGLGLPWWLSSKESACNAGDLGSIPGLGRSPGEGNGNPPQWFLAWRIPWTEEPGGLKSMGHKESDTTELLHFWVHLVCSQEPSILAYPQSSTLAHKWFYCYFFVFVFICGIWCFKIVLKILVKINNGLKGRLS